MPLRRAQGAGLPRQARLVSTGSTRVREGASASSTRLRGDGSHVGGCGGREVGGEAAEESDTVEAGPAGGECPRRQSGVEVGDHAPIIEGTDVTREGLPIVQVATGIRMPLQENAVQPGKPVEVPPPGGRLCRGAREAGRRGDEQGGGVTQLEGVQDLFDLVDEEGGADPQTGGDGAAADPAEPPAKLVAGVAL